MRHNRDKVAKAFGRVLRDQRERVGISQEELGLRASVDRTFVWRLEKGLTQPSLALIVVLAKVLEVDPAALVSEAVVRLQPKR